MRETDRSQGLVGLFLTSALHRFGGVEDPDADAHKRYDSSRSGSRVRSVPIRRTSSQPLAARSKKHGPPGNAGKGNSWEATAYSTPTRVPRRRCLTPPLAEDENDVARGRTEEGGGARALDGIESYVVGNGEDKRERLGNGKAAEWTAPAADPQLQSGLFRLPSTVRMAIYEHVLGGKVLRIVGGLEGKLKCFVIAEAKDLFRELVDEERHEIKGPSWLAGLDFGGHENDEWDGIPRDNEKTATPARFLPLLQSCRAIYKDTIPILYTTNTFSFTKMESFINFSRSVPPHRLDAIQSITTDFRYDLSNPTGFSVADSDNATPRSNWPRWERTWRIIDTMGKLQSLIVRIEWGKPLFATEEERLLGPLFGVRGLKVFEVEVGPLRKGEMGRLNKEERMRMSLEKRWGTWKKQQKVEKVKEVPFRLLRR